MRSMIKLAGAAALLGCAATASADSFDLRTADHNGAAELARGDNMRAGRVLAASLQVSPRAADLLLNQAALDARTGRVEAARAGYRAVLAQPDEDVVMADGSIRSAHALARLGTQRTAATTLVAR